MTSRSMNHVKCGSYVCLWGSFTHVKELLVCPPEPTVGHSSSPSLLTPVMLSQTVQRRTQLSRQQQTMGSLQYTGVCLVFSGFRNTINAALERKRRRLLSMSNMLVALFLTVFFSENLRVPQQDLNLRRYTYSAFAEWEFQVLFSFFLEHTALSGYHWLASTPVWKNQVNFTGWCIQTYVDG